MAPVSYTHLVVGQEAFEILFIHQAPRQRHGERRLRVLHIAQQVRGHEVVVDHALIELRAGAEVELLEVLIAVVFAIAIGFGEARRLRHLSAALQGVDVGHGLAVGAVRADHGEVVGKAAAVEEVGVTAVGVDVVGKGAHEHADVVPHVGDDGGVAVLHPGLIRHEHARDRPADAAVGGRLIVLRVGEVAVHEVRGKAREGAVGRAVGGIGNGVSVIAVELRDVGNVHRRVGVHLRVAREAEAFVALRAVGGDADVVAQRGADDVFEQLVGQRRGGVVVGRSGLVGGADASTCRSSSRPTST